VVTLTTDSGRQTKSLQAGSGFLAQHSKELLFGLGNAKGAISASVRWPSGQVQQLHDLLPNHRVLVEEGKGSRSEPFVPKTLFATGSSAPPVSEEMLPSIVETWLLAPIAAPDFSLSDLASRSFTVSQYRGKGLLAHFWTTASSDCLKDLETFSLHHSRWSQQGLQLLSLNTDDTFDESVLRSFTKKESLPFPILHASDHVAGIYNLLYRYLFDRHRDLPLPASFLINDNGQIVKIYQGPVSADHIEHDFAHIPRTATERLAKALPFPGVTDATEFQRNHLALGSVFFQREYFDQAKAFFELAQRDDPSSAEALYGLGSVYLKQSKTAEARDCFERATKLQASFPETLPNAWNNLGLLATQQGRTEDAIPFFEQALKLSPNHLIALDNLASAYRQQKRWTEARQVLERSLTVSPQNPEANYSLGMVYAQTNDEQHAYEYLQRALQARPDYPEALNNMGVLNLRAGHRDEAVKTFEECMRVAPDFDQAYLNLARVYALEGDRNKARAVLDVLLRRHPEHPAAKKMLTELGQ
jgi:tetratricopeptide (TPR) repeat protein